MDEFVRRGLRPRLPNSSIHLLAIADRQSEKGKSDCCKVLKRWEIKMGYRWQRLQPFVTHPLGYITVGGGNFGNRTSRLAHLEKRRLANDQARSRKQSGNP